MNKGQWLVEHLGFAMKSVRPYGKHPKIILSDTNNYTLQRTNISNPKALLKMIFFSKVGYMI